MAFHLVKFFVGNIIYDQPEKLTGFSLGKGFIGGTGIFFRARSVNIIKVFG
jgi:hypothetical protein